MRDEVIEEAVYERYIMPTKRKSTRLLGLELELPIVNKDNMPVDFKIVHKVTDEFVRHFMQKEQIQAVQNFKKAARYDLKTVRITTVDGENCSVARAAINIIDEMKHFYETIGLPAQDILEFEYSKFMEGEKRYAWQIRQRFETGYVKKVLELARERQEETCVNCLE